MISFEATVLGDLINGPFTNIAELLNVYIIMKLKPFTYSRKRHSKMLSSHSYTVNTYLITLKGGDVISFDLRIYTNDYIGNNVRLSYYGENVFLPFLLQFFELRGIPFREVRKQAKMTSEEIQFTDQFFSI